MRSAYQPRSGQHCRPRGASPAKAGAGTLDVECRSWQISARAAQLSFSPASQQMVLACCDGLGRACIII